MYIHIWIYFVIYRRWIYFVIQSININVYRYASNGIKSSLLYGLNCYYLIHLGIMIEDNILDENLV